MRGFAIRFPLFTPLSPMRVTRPAIRMSLELLTALNRLWLRFYPKTPSIYSSGVLYRREGPGREVWQTIPAAIASGYADCEDLACWLAAEYRESGVSCWPDIKVKRRSNGSILAHVIVRFPDGREEDPSARLGMYA